MKENIVKIKSFDFESISLFKKLFAKSQFVLSKQFSTSATSIGANIEEANVGSQKKIFLVKWVKHLRRAEKL
jgi:four helix bundle protein